MLNIESLSEEAKKRGMPPSKMRGVLREYLQIIVLKTLYSLRESGKYFFTGGTYLRLVYNTKMFSEDNIVHVFFDTNKDVEEWEYSAIFDLFDEDIFKKDGLEIDTVEDEYNPTWLVKFQYIEDYSIMNEKIDRLCDKIEYSIKKVFEDIEGKEIEYK